MPVAQQQASITPKDLITPWVKHHHTSTFLLTDYRKLIFA